MTLPIDNERRPGRSKSPASLVGCENDVFQSNGTFAAANGENGGGEPGPWTKTPKKEYSGTFGGTTGIAGSSGMLVKGFHNFLGDAC